MTYPTLSPPRYLGTILFSVGAAAALMAMTVGPKLGAAKPTTLRIVARDFAYEVPASIPSGLTRIELVNQSQNLHHA